MIPSTNHSQSGFLTDMNGGKVCYHLKKGDLSGIQMGPRQMKALELGCAAMALNKVSALA
jgi:hypothetical protein